MRKTHQQPNWWQTGFVQLISKLSVEAYKQSDQTYLTLEPASDRQTRTERSNRVIPLSIKTK